ncbi:MAG TPA: hypothetical protein VD887_11310 [Allosphingosinicella sp.]|nr:hypothetical protein [Allosphingosinicella sp.]
MVEREEREVESEPVVERHTTVVSTGGGRGGGGGTLLAVLLLVVALVVLFLVFGRGLLEGQDVNVNVGVEAPDVELPKVDPAPTQPSG